MMCLERDRARNDTRTWDLAGETVFADSVSESAGWFASSSLRGCSEETDEILVPVDMGIQSENMVRWLPERSHLWKTFQKKALTFSTLITEDATMSTRS